MASPQSVCAEPAAGRLRAHFLGGHLSHLCGGFPPLLAARRTTLGHLEWGGKHLRQKADSRKRSARVEFHAMYATASLEPSLRRDRPNICYNSTIRPDKTAVLPRQPAYAQSCGTHRSQVARLLVSASRSSTRSLDHPSMLIRYQISALHNNQRRLPWSTFPERCAARMLAMDCALR